MIITRSWLNEWIDLSGISTDELVKTFNSIGLEVDSVTTSSIPQKIVFGRVLECEKHPDADTLNIATINIGGEKNIEIVCGGTNLKEKTHVPVALPGAVIPGNFIIQKSKWVFSKIDYFKSSQRINEIEDINKTSLSPTVISFSFIFI